MRSDITLTLSDTSLAALNGENSVNFTYNLLDLHFDHDLSVDTLGVEVAASIWADLGVDFYASLTLPQTGFMAELTLADGGWADRVVETGAQVTLITGTYAFSDVTSTSLLNLSTLGFSSGFDVNFSAGISDITLDSALSSEMVIDGFSLGTDGVERFELLGFELGRPEGEHFSSEITSLSSTLNALPVEQIMQGTYGVQGVPLDLNWNFWALGFDETTQDQVVIDSERGDFLVQDGSGNPFLSAVLDLDDLVARFMLPVLSNPLNPLLSPFEFNWSTTLFEGRRWELNPQLLAALLDVDLEIGVELVQQTGFTQTAGTVTVSHDGATVASGALGDSLSFDGMQSAGTQNYQVTYGAGGDLTTSYGIMFTIDAPVSVLDMSFWNGDLEFAEDDHGFTEPDIPDDAWNLTVYDHTFRLAQSSFIPIPGMDRVTAVEFVSQAQDLLVEFTDDSWRATSSGDPAVSVNNPENMGGAACDITGSSGDDSLQGDDCDNVINALTGRDTLLGGAGDDLLLVSYAGFDDNADVVYGGAGQDRAVYNLGGYATLYNVNFFDATGTEITDFDRLFDLSRDLTNFTRIQLWGGAGTDFYQVEAIDIDASDAARSGSVGNFWYLGGSLYLGSGGSNIDRFIANWSDQTVALDWNLGAVPVQTLSNGVTVGYMETLHTRHGRGDDRITGGNGADYIDGGSGNDTLNGGTGRDTLVGGDGNDLLLVSYAGTDDNADVVYGGAGQDRAVYNLGGYATLYNVHFFDATDTEITDFDRLFDLSRDLTNFTRVQLWGGAGTDFYQVEAIDIDASDAARSGSGNFWYLGGTRYIGSGGANIDRFIANWADQSVSLIWDAGADDVQRLANGVTVGNMERLHVRFGSGHDSITGLGLNDQLDGGEGNDTLRGGTGRDTLIGGAGNDVLFARNDYVADRDDNLDGGAGDDTAWFTLDVNDYYGPIIRMQFVTEDGTYFTEVEDIFANLDDVMANGSIQNAYNDNTVFRNIEHINIDARTAAGQGASAGNQIWYLGGTEYYGSISSAQDQFYADWSDQSVSVTWDIAGEQVATLANGVTVGYIERAYLRLGSGDDHVAGGDGNDTFAGGAGDDLLDGAGGQDVLHGGTGNDLLNGGEGNDTLEGGRGDDILGGGYGMDTYRIAAGDGMDALLDPDRGTVHFTGLSAEDVTLLRDGSTLEIGFQDQPDGVRILNFFAQARAFDFYFDGVAQVLDTAALADPWDDLGRVVTRVDDDSNTVWRLLPAGEFVYMNGGTDGIYAGVGADLIDGGAGLDVVSYEESPQGVQIGMDGEPGFGGLAAGDRLRNIEALRGSAYNDSLIGSLGNDTLAGDAGNDLLVGGAGDDSIYGQAGDDTLLGGVGDDRLDGGAGDDLASFAGDAGVRVSLLIDGPQDTGMGLDTLIGIENLEGSTVNDVLIGDAGNNLLLGGDGLDTLIGGDGDDRLIGGSSIADLRDMIYGGDGNDWIDGGYGNDELRGDAGNDTISGGFGVDNIVGGLGDDLLTGQAWSDLIFGGDGADFINGGFGFDRLNGGGGADRFFHLGIADHGIDWVQDYHALEGDVLIFGGGDATGSDFLVQMANTQNAGDAGIQEAFVTHIPSGNLLWALIDGGGQEQINLMVNGVIYDLLAA